MSLTECRHRGAALALHFAEGDAATLAAAESHLASCAACRAYREELAGLQAALQTWVEEPPPPALRERVLARALATPRQAPAPRSTPHALPLFLLVPVMAALVAATMLVAAQLEAWLYSPGYHGLVLLDVLGPTASAALVLLALGGLATLALAPALFLESRGPRRTLGAHA
jgi:hypothetical protein